MCKAGCLLFKEWKSLFFCGSGEVHISFMHGVEPLKASGLNVKNCILLLWNFMDDCLKKWKLYIDECRQDHHFLNAFTTGQLVFLGKQLVFSEDDEDRPFDKGVYPLLQRISPGCSYEMVREALKESMELHKAPETEPEEGSELSPEDEFREALRENAFDEDLITAALKALGPHEIEDGMGNPFTFFTQPAAMKPRDYTKS
jgi:hypothetical protein